MSSTNSVTCRIIWCFHYPSDSDRDYRIFNMHRWCFLHVYVDRGPPFTVSSKGLFIESARNLMPGKSQGSCKVWHMIIPHPRADHTPSCLTWLSTANVLVLCHTLSSDYIVVTVLCWWCEMFCFSGKVVCWHVLIRVQVKTLCGFYISVICWQGLEPSTLIVTLMLGKWMHL